MSHLSTRQPWIIFLYGSHGQPCHVDQIMDQTFWKQVLTMRYCRGGNWQWDIVVVGGSGMTAHMWRCLRNSNFRHSFHSQTGTKFCKIYFGIHRWPDLMQNHEGLHNIHVRKGLYGCLSTRAGYMGCIVSVNSRIFGETLLERWLSHWCLPITLTL